MCPVTWDQNNPTRSITLKIEVIALLKLCFENKTNENTF